MRLCQDLLQHQGVDIHHAILEQMQGEHADFMIFAAIAGHFAATSEEDKIVGAVPLLDEAPSTWQLQIDGKRDRLSEARRYA
jgi:hypothetical protein